jgi:hypothetical protein
LGKGGSIFKSALEKRNSSFCLASKEKEEPETGEQETVRDLGSEAASVEPPETSADSDE